MKEKILSLEETDQRCRALRDQGQKVVLTNGCFDLLHVGHVRYLRQARELGDALVVALNSDDSVRALKGPGRPIVPEAERAEGLASLGCVDYVTIFREQAAARVAATLRPDIYVKGGDYATCRSGVPEVQVVTECGGLVVFLDFEPGASTSGIIEAILRRARNRLHPLKAEVAAQGELWR
ncbi:MAG: hypothetical protein A2148_12310 [Chloroflexi bacterium RBG_16_68_14]|nr:MAG: hypothetical protein A2148_12310 [Chloroflexi bacterium RBG_16_68_14]